MIAGNYLISHTLEEAFDAAFKATAFPSHSKIKTHELIGAELIRSKLFTQQIKDFPPWLRRAILLVMLADASPAISPNGTKVRNSIFCNTLPE